MEPIKAAISEIHNMFNVINKEFYSSELPTPALVIQTNGRKKSALGWCTTERVWHGDSEHLYEITMCSEYMTRPLEDLTSTLMHEMVHLYNIIHDVKDVSRSGYYHNKKFKAEGEKRGLIIEKAPTIGWSVTKLNEKTLKWLKKKPFNRKSFVVARTGALPAPDDDSDSDGEEGTKKKKKSHIRKYICPGCGTIIRASKIVKVVCGDCMELFICESHDDDSITKAEE